MSQGLGLWIGKQRTDPVADVLTSGAWDRRAPARQRGRRLRQGGADAEQHGQRRRRSGRMAKFHDQSLQNQEWRLASPLFQADRPWDSP